MLEIVNQGKNDRDVEWFTVWRDSDERNVVLKEIDEMHASKRDEPEEDDPHSGDEFAMPFGVQLIVVMTRVFQQYWRMPAYVLAKSFLAVAAGLFIGFSFFQADGSLAGMQNVIFSVFMLTTIFSTLVQQVCLKQQSASSVIDTNRCTDPTTIRHATKPVRSSRATIQIILVESVHDCEHHC
jgi:hypothetical protein